MQQWHIVGVTRDDTGRSRTWRVSGIPRACNEQMVRRRLTKRHKIWTDPTGDIEIVTWRWVESEVPHSFSPPDAVVGEEANRDLHPSSQPARATQTSSAFVQLTSEFTSSLHTGTGPAPVATPRRAYTRATVQEMR